MSKMNNFIDMAKTMKLLQELMEKKGLSISDLKEKLSSSKLVDNWFNGSSTPSLNDLLELSNLFNLPVDQIIVKKDRECSSNSDYKIVVSEHDLPPEDFKRMGDLALRYNIPFQDLIEIFNRGFKFYEASALYDDEVENDYLN